MQKSSRQLDIFLFCGQAVVPRYKVSRKIIEVDSNMIDKAVEDLAKLILRLDENTKKTRKEKNTIKKIQEIRDTLQDSVLCEIEKKHTVMRRLTKSQLFFFLC